MPGLRTWIVGLMLTVGAFAQDPEGWDAVNTAASGNARNAALSVAHKLASTEPGGMARLLAAENAFLEVHHGDPVVAWWRVEALMQMRRLTEAAQESQQLLASDPTAPALSAQEGDIALRDFDTRSALAAWTRAGESRRAAATGLAAHREALESVRARQWLWLGGFVLLLTGAVAVTRMCRRGGG